MAIPNIQPVQAQKRHEEKKHQDAFGKTMGNDVSNKVFVIRHPELLGIEKRLAHSSLKAGSEMVLPFYLMFQSDRHNTCK
jgi:hypothetical protein